jgi:hypothetical protein
MCITGIHLLDAPISVLATILKFFIPLGLIYWLTLNAVDRRIESQPFIKRKLMLVAALAVIMLTESFLDMHFLFSIRPRIVSCCTSVFDVPKNGALKAIRQSGMIWMGAFYSFFAVTMSAYFMRHKFNKVTKAISALSSLSALVLLVFMLQTRVSPVMLEAPYHQCAFCLWQGFPDIAISSGAVILGLWLAFVCAIMPDLQRHHDASAYAEKMAVWAVLLYSIGTIWITIRYSMKCLF